MIGNVIGHYRITRQLGAGGMGVVYEAEDTRLGRLVALKFLPESHGYAPEQIERFLREARIASSLNHPNICTIYDVGIHEGRHFIAMERLEGESLRGRIHGQPLSLDLILDVGCQLADALDAAHAKGIIHRDIKPANVFLSKRGQAKLLDFGIAKLGESPGDHDSTAETRVGGELTTPGMTVGSINYMSPEQARGEELDARSDLFSVGLVLYEMATGRQAFEGKTTAVVFDAILNRQPIDPRAANPAIPEALQRVIVRALEKDRKLRFQTAADVLAELQRIRTPTAGSATVAATQPAASPSAAPRGRLLGLAAVLVVVLGVAGYFLFLRAPGPQLGERDTLLVADFANTTGDPVFDEALRGAVLVQLQQTPFVTLLADQRIQRTIRLMQQPPDTPVVGEVAREACQRSGAKATVEGSISALGSNYVIALAVHNCQTGESLARQQVQAASKEDVINQIGVAVKGLRQHLGESLATIQKYDVPVTEATTKSLEALRAYGQGLKARATRGDEASIPFFREATERDPNFALAWAKLGVVSGNLFRNAEARDHANKAYQLRDKVSEYERLYINWNYAARVLQDQKAAKEALELLIASYPRDFAGRNNLGVHYNNNGQAEEALKEYRAAIDLAPDEPGPLANAAFALLQLGRPDEASDLIDKLLERRPDANLAIARWMFARVSNSPRTAEFEQVARKIAGPDQMTLAEAGVASWLGQLKVFERLQDEFIAKSTAAGSTDAANGAMAGKLITLAVYRGGADLAALKDAAAREKNPMLLAQCTSALAMLGDIDGARAGLRRIEADPRAADAGGAIAVARAYAQAKDGQAPAAIAGLQTALLSSPRSRDLHYFIGDIKEQIGDADGAIGAYRLVISSMTYLGPSPLIPAARLKLAQALLKKNDRAGANEQLDALLTQWKDADTEFPALIEARKLRAAQPK